jgi:multimeric flavodoxin WrbA
MKLMVFNGSPRGNQSNSTKLIRWINNEESENIHYLNKSSLYEEYLKEAETADSYLFVFPLYVDSMPGITKAFFEVMEQNKSLFTGKPVYFVVHSGFPEMIQSRSLSRYTAYFSKSVMGMEYKGTIIIGGSESMQMAPDNAFRKLQSILKEAGKYIEEGKDLPEDINMRINKRERMPWIQRSLFSLAPGFLKNFYWHYRARQHKEKINLKAQPY